MAKQHEFIGVGSVVLAGVLVLSGCSGAAGASQASAGDQGSKTDQAWAKSYSDTTCQEFKTWMTDSQRRAAAADMLARARTKGDQPNDQLVTTFLRGVQAGCAIATMSLADTGAAAYRMDKVRLDTH